MYARSKYRPDHGFGSERNAYLIHYCSLPQEEDVIVHYIQAGWCITLRRKLKEWVLVSETHPRTRWFLKSSAAIRQERMRHLQYYFYSIHPLSNFRVYWQIVMIFVLLVSMLIIPAQITDSYFSTEFFTITLFFDIMCLTNCFLNFWTGYYTLSYNKIILDRTLIRNKYLRGHFFLDFLTSVPLYLVPRFNKGIIYMMTIFIKFLRIIPFMIYMRRYKEWREWSSFKFRIMKAFIIFFFCIILTNCIVYIGNKSTYSYWTGAPTWLSFHRLFYSCFRGLCMIFLVEFGDQPIRSPYLLCATAVGIQVGFILQSYMLASFLQLMRRSHTSSTKFKEMLEHLTEYIRFKGLPVKMRNRMYLYFDYKYRKQFYNEKEIMNTLSPPLQHEILSGTCMRFVEKVEFFQDLPPTLLLNISSCLKTVVYLPDDIVVQAGQIGDAMFFIKYGSLAVFTMHGIEVCHLSDGSHFGEISLLLEEKRVATVVALIPCELLRLSKSDFQQVTEDYPECFFRMRRMAHMRMEMGGRRGFRQVQANVDSFVA